MLVKGACVFLAHSSAHDLDATVHSYASPLPRSSSIGRHASSGAAFGSAAVTSSGRIDEMPNTVFAPSACSAAPEK